MGRRVQCLKYLVLANMLMESKVDPFDAQVRRGMHTAACPVHMGHARLPRMGPSSCRCMPKAVSMQGPEKHGNLQSGQRRRRQLDCCAPLLRSAAGCCHM